MQISDKSVKAILAFIIFLLTGTNFHFHDKADKAEKQLLEQSKALKSCYPGWKEIGGKK